MKRALLIVLLAVGLLTFTAGPAVAADGVSTDACTTPQDFDNSFSTQACTTPQDVSLQCGGGGDDDDGGGGC